MKAVSVYVDGFNLYHALDDLQQPHLKWLDLWALSQSLCRADETVRTVKYFSAYATWRESSYRRHQVYVSALESRGVKFIEGRFKEGRAQCRRCQTRWKTHEEKETDVNIGVHLMADAMTRRFDRALVVSADTDLNAAVLLTRHESGRAVDIIAPPRRKGRNSQALFEITLGRIRSSLLPSEIVHGGRTIRRPADYAPPS